MIRPIADFIADEQLGPDIGEPLPHRQCDGCTACCILPGINAPELRKAQYVRCRHLAGNGCGIYGDRPPVCRAYLCLWRLLEELPEAARPDKCGVLFAYHLNRAADGFSRRSVIAVAANGPADFDHPAARAALDALIAAEAMPVHLEHRGQQMMIFPDPELADAMLHPETTGHRHLLERAAALRRKWQMSAAAGEPRP